MECLQYNNAASKVSLYFIVLNLVINGMPSILRTIRVEEGLGRMF